MAAITDPHLDQVIDLAPILEKAQERNGLISEDAANARKWYLRHLQLCHDYPEVTLSAISRKADELWHQHILDTKRMPQTVISCLARWCITSRSMATHLKMTERSMSGHWLFDQKEFGEESYDPEMLCGISM